MFQPRLLDRIGNSVSLEGLFEDLTAAREVTAHDRMFGMSLVEGPSAVDDRRAEIRGRMLVLQLLDACAVHVAKEKPDHPVLEHAVDEGVDDRSEFNFAAQLFEEARRSGLGVALNLTLQTEPALPFG